MTLSDHSKPTLFRRLWVVVILTCLLITMPLALVILLTGPIYRRTPDGYAPLGKRAHRAYAGLLALWLGLATARALLMPGGLKQEWANSADPDLPKPTTSQASSAQQPSPSKEQTAGALTAAADNDLPACDSQETAEAVKGAIEEGAASELVSVTVEDYGKATEIFFDKQQPARHCAAEAVLNIGQTHVTFQIFRGPSGKLIVQAQTGQRADLQSAVDEQMMQHPSNAIVSGAKENTSSPSNLTADEDDADVKAQYSSDYLTCTANAENSSNRNGATVKCIQAEIDFQNLRFKQQFGAKMSALPRDQADEYRTAELAWADRMERACSQKSYVGGVFNPTAEPRCVLNGTIRHMRSM